jgi:hypothetical protein
MSVSMTPGGRGGGRGSGARSFFATSGSGKGVDMAQARAEMRMNMLTGALPNAVNVIGSQGLLELASASYDDADMMEEALNLIGATGITSRISELKEMNDEEQWGQFNSMNPTVRDALKKAGWNPKAPDEGGGWGGFFKSALSAGVTAPINVAKTSGSGAKWAVQKGLSALAYPAEEVTRLARVAPLMDAQRRVMDQSGMDAAQLQEIGIDASNASATGGMTGDMNLSSASGLLGMAGAVMLPVPGIPNPLNAVKTMATNPTDIWGAMRTWKEIGHSGADDYLATVQYEIYQNLEDEHEGAGKDMLRYVKAFAAGRDLNELAEEEGVAPEARQAFIDRLAALRDTDLFKQSVDRLESGRVSPGRTVARQLHQDMDADVSSGGDKLISGTVDLAFGVIMDPTLAAGKLTKATRAARWATRAENAQDLNRWQRMTEIVENSDTAEDAAKALADLPGRGWKAMRFGTMQRRLASEAKAVHAPAKAIATAYETGDFYTLIRKYPALEASKVDMDRFHRFMVEAGEEGLTKPANTFEFYKWILGERETVAKIGTDAMKPSMKLFGMNGLGHTMVPHATAIQRGRMKIKLALSNALHTPFSERLSKESLDALGEHAKEVADSIDEATELAEPALVQRDILMAEAASEDEALAMAAKAELAVREVADQLDEKHIDPDTLGFVLKSGDVIRERFSRFVRTVTTKVPKQGFVDIADDGSPEDFRNFAESLAIITQTPKSLAAAKYNQFVAAPAAVKHAMINKMIYDAADGTGLLDTAAGKEIIRKHIEKSNQIYGVDDLVRHSIDDTRATTFQVHQAIHEGQLASKVSIPSFRDWIIATGAVARKTNGIRWAAGQVRNSHVEAMTTRIWKPSVMFGLGFGLRAGSDEALTFIGRVGLSHYGRQAFLDRWAGLRDEAGKLVLRADGSVMREPQAAIAPMRWVVNSVAHIAGVTDDVLAAKAKNLAMEDAAWSVSDELARTKILETAKKTVASDLRIIPKTLRGVDLFAKSAAMWSSKAVHEIAGDKKFLSRAEMAAAILKRDPDFAARARSARLAMTNPIFRQAQVQAMGHTYSEMATFDRANDVTGRTIDVAADTPSGVRAIKVSNSDYAWVGDNDLGLKMHHFEHQLKSMAANPAPRAAMSQYGNEVPQSVIGEVSKAFRDVIGDAEGVDAVRAARAYVAEKATAEGGGEAMALMRKANISEKTRQILTARIDDRTLTNNLDAIADRAYNAAYNALRSRENSANLRALVAASTMDGKLPMVPLKQGHDRLYFPVIDRRSAEDLVHMLPEGGQAQKFAELLSINLKRINAGREMQSVFESFPPQQGFDMATWMAGMKATLAQNEGNYIPAGLAASTNPRVAEAIRDTIDEMIPGQTLRPRLAFIDHPPDAFDPRYGVQPHAQSKSVVNLAPYQTAGMQTIDPDSARRIVHVEIQRPGQRPERYWLGEEELADVAGVRGRAESMKVKKVSRTNTFTKIGRNKVLVNKNLIEADFEAGMPFLRGQGGTMRVTSKAWEFPPEMQQRADELAAVLDSHGLGYDTGLDLDDLITEFHDSKSRYPVNFEAEMADNRLLEEFQEVAGAAIPGGTRVTQELDDESTRFASPIVKEAMDRLGISADQLTDSREYVDLLVERARAHAVLDAAGEYAPRVVTEEAVNREMDALAYAWVEAGLGSNDKIAARLTMNADAGDYKVLGEVWASGFTEEAAVRRAAQNIAQEVKRAVHGAKTGEPLHELIHPLLAGQHTSDRLIRAGFPMDELPARAFGPKEIVASEARLSKVVQRLYQGVAEPTIQAISRQPMTMHSFHTRMQANQHIFNRLVNQNVDAAAKAQLTRLGIDPKDLEIVNENLISELKIDKDFGLDAADDLTEYARAVVKGDEDGIREGLAKITGGPVELDDEGLKTLRGWHLNQNEALEAQVRRSTFEAIDMVTPFVDDHRVRSAFQEYLGPVFLPFYYAEEQFLRRLAKGIYENPNMVRKAQLAIHGMESMGMIRENERGQKMLVLPGTDVLWESVGWVAAEVTGNEIYRVDVDPFGMRLDYVLPGWNISESRFGFGPIVGLAADQLTARFPEAEWAGRRDNGQMIDYLLPSKLIAGYKLFAGDAKEVGTAEVSAIGMLEAAGMGPPEDASAFEKEEYLSDVRNVTRAIGGMRLATGLLTLGSFQPLDAGAKNRAEYMQLLAEGVSHDQAKRVLVKRHSTSDEEIPFSEEFQELLGEGVSHEDALMKMLERHGPNGLVWTVFGSENQVGAPLPANEATWEFMLDNEELITSHPETMAWLFPQMKDGDEFDFRAYNEQAVLGLREKRTPEEFLNQLYVAQGRPGYFAMTDRHADEREELKLRKASQEEKDAVDMVHRAERQAYINMHPAVADSFSPEASERRKKVLRDLPVLIKGGVGGEQGEALKPLLERYQQFKMNYDALKPQSTKAARAEKKRLADEFYTDGLLLVRGQPQLAAFFNSVIRPEMPDNADTEQVAA